MNGAGMLPPLVPFGRIAMPIIWVFMGGDEKFDVNQSSVDLELASHDKINIAKQGLIQSTTNQICQ